MKNQRLRTNVDQHSESNMKCENECTRLYHELSTAKCEYIYTYEIIHSLQEQEKSSCP